MWDWLAYVALGVAVFYALFIIWQLQRGSFDGDDDPC
jgi:uncharacterized membrane protein